MLTLASIYNSLCSIEIIFCNVIMYLLISAKRTFLEVCKVSHMKQI